MGIYLNPGTTGFRESLNSQIYVDKSGLIAHTSACLGTKQKYMCVSRPRRFGKSMAMDMLAAYYNCGVDSHELFEGSVISKDASFEANINKYNVIKLNIQMFLSSTHDIDEMLKKIKQYVTAEIKIAYPNLIYLDDTDLAQTMADVYVQTGKQFVILMDEWDCIFREYREKKEEQNKYLDFLRMWLKDQEYVALAYMTGILPIKKYGTHSALNMFTEYSMTDPGELAEFFGFTDAEVKNLCQAYTMDYAECKAWYDGYTLKSGDTVYSMYNPKSVVEAMLRHKFGTYWNRTETYEALKVYIQMNMDGLKDAVVSMMTGARVEIDICGFENDMVTFAGADDVMTLLTHLGYLTYDEDARTVEIPNKEVYQEYATSVKRMEGWGEVARSVDASRKLLERLWEKDGEAVAKAIDTAHNEISILKYNDENSLSCTINLAFYFAKEYYNIVREFPTGKGFADICFVPRPLHMDKPAAIIELKYDKTANGAIEQIRQKQYVDAFKDYHGNLLLCGINYDKDTKTHTCEIKNTEL